MSDTVDRLGRALRLTIVPVFQHEARRFVGRHHRHNVPSITAIFNVGIAADGELVGVAMVGLPKARLLADGKTLEVTRTCIKGDIPNGNSMLYGACARAAKALGWRKIVTYTLPSESGVSLRAAGWLLETSTAGGGSWEHHSLRPGRDVDMFGHVRIPDGPKLRWSKAL